MLKITPKKANLSLLVGALILVAIAFIVFEFRPEKEASPVGSDNLAVAGDAATQSYAVSQTPTARIDDRIFGSADAPLKIYVFEDYSSFFSASLADNLEKARVDFGDRLAVIVRPYARNSELAAQAAAAVDCAASQGKWREMRALLFSKVKNKQPLEPGSPDYSRQLGLDTDEFSLCLTNERKSGKIEQATAAAEALQVYGAPTIFVGNEMIPGARPYEDYTDSDGEQVAGLKTIIARKISQD